MRQGALDGWQASWAGRNSEAAKTLPMPYQRATWDSLLDDLAERVAVRLLDRLAPPPGKGGLPDELLTAREVCALLSISRSSLDRLVAQGDLQVVKVGACNRYPLASVNAYFGGDQRRSA